MFTALFAFLFGLIPFEVPIANRPSVAFLYYGTLIIAAIVALLEQRFWFKAKLATKAGRDFRFSILLYVAIGLLSFAAGLLHGAGPVAPSLEFLFGFFLPSVLITVIFFSSDDKQRLAWRCFYGGYVLYLLVSLVLLRSSFGAAQELDPAWDASSRADQLLSWHFLYNTDWNNYARWVGNPNLQANKLLVYLLLCVRLPVYDPNAREKAVKLLLFAFVILGTFSTIVLMSRLGLLLLPVVILGSGLLRRIPKIFTTVVLVCLITASFSLSALLPFYQYILGSGDKDMGFLGTGLLRIEQWVEAVSFLIDDPANLLFGLGGFRYETLFPNWNSVTTHNVLLDLWVSGGILLPILFLLFLGRAGWRIIKQISQGATDMVALSLFTLVFILIFRDMMFAYMTTIHSGFTFVLLAYVVARSGSLPDRPKKRNLPHGRNAMRSTLSSSV